MIYPQDLLFPFAFRPRLTEGAPLPIVAAFRAPKGPFLTALEAKMTVQTSSSLMQTYARSQLAFERGEGAYLFTADGRRFLDFASGIAVTALGHSHPHLIKALTDQAQKLVAHLEPLSGPGAGRSSPSA